MIQCLNVCKSFSDKKILSDVCFNINEGQIFGLLGPSGAGKTTLIKILTGQLSFDSGKVRILDKPVEKLTGFDRKQIGIMMDQFGVYERLSCRDNLKIFADIYGISYDRIDETLKTVGLIDAAKTRASDLSKGMRARLQLARVFMNSPKIIFLDEPTSGLDPQVMRATHRMILDKKKSGCTIFLTTHNMEEAALLCDTVALLNEGKIVDMDSPDKLCRKYNHQKKLNIHLKSGEDIELSNCEASAGKVAELILNGSLETIHSSEPTLETVFLELTGRKLQEEN